MAGANDALVYANIQLMQLKKINAGRRDSKPSLNVFKAN